MYLSNPVLSITYESGNTYIASIEQETDKIRVFWEDEDTDTELTEQSTISEDKFQCFTVFDARDEAGEYRSLENVEEQTRDLIAAHKLEPGSTVQQTHTYEATQYPPN